MKGIAATGRNIRLVSVLALGLGLAGCSDLDNSLFGAPDDSGSVPAASPDQVRMSATVAGPNAAR